MLKLSSFEKFLSAFEAPVISEEKLKRLHDSCVKDRHIYSSFFENYIGTRIHENIHSERLLNMAYHMELSEDTYFLSMLINRRLASSILYRNEGFDQFYFMCRHDLRTDRHVLTELIKALARIGDEDILRITNIISSQIGIDKYTLIVKILSENNGYNTLRRLTLMDKLDTEEQFIIWTKSIENNSNLFDSFTYIDFNMNDHIIKNHLKKYGDEDIFAKALLISIIPMASFEISYSLNKILTTCSETIPNTIEYLYRRAEQEERYEYLLTLGANKNKKELLQSIVKSKNHELIDKFFLIYKDYPEVKHLVPFI